MPSVPHGLSTVSSPSTIYFDPHFNAITVNYDNGKGSTRRPIAQTCDNRFFSDLRKPAGIFTVPHAVCSGMDIPAQQAPPTSSRKMPEALPRQQKEDSMIGSTSLIWKDPPNSTISSTKKKKTK